MEPQTVYIDYIERKPTMKKFLTAALTIAVTTSVAVRIVNRAAPGAVDAYKTQVEAVAPITECYSVKLNRETGEKVTTTYAC